MTLTDFCVQRSRTELLEQWDAEQNGALQPEAFSHGSHQRIWWRCEKGHSWQARINSRVGGAGCPVCTGRIVLEGVNDLAACEPELAAQWHESKNGELKPSQVRAGSNRKVWWLCEKGHEWQATVNSRARGVGCPVCRGKVAVAGENDLASAFPQIAEEWDAEKNQAAPESVTPYSNRKVWWRCERGHEWQASVASRTSMLSGCPYCTGRKVLPGFNDLGTVCPEIAGQWCYELNGKLRPEMLTSGSQKKVWWKCEEGHVWKAVVYSRTGARKHGCPVCAGTRHRGNKTQ